MPILWPLIFKTGNEIAFAHTSFKWANLASHNAGVTVAIVGISNQAGKVRRLFSIDESGVSIEKKAENINAYLIAGENIIVEKAMKPIAEVNLMDFGNKADDGGHLTLVSSQLQEMNIDEVVKRKFIKQFYGSKEFIIL